MSKIVLDSVRFHNQLDKKIKAVVESSFKADGKGLRTLTHKFDAAIKKEVFIQAYGLAPIIDKIIRTHYKDSLAIVADNIARGMKMGEHIYGDVYADFDPYSAKYAARKRKYYPQNADLFWKRGGNDWRAGGSDPEQLAIAVRKAAAGWKGGVSRKKVVAEFLTSRKTHNKRKYSFFIGMELPPINSAGGFLDTILRRAYLGIAVDMTGAKLAALYNPAEKDPYNIPIDRIVANEAWKPRPFIAKLMATRGSEVKALIEGKIRAIQ